MPVGAERGPRRVALAASPGGHIDLLVALRAAVADSERLWVLPDGGRRRELAAQNERTAQVRLFGSSPGRLVGNLRDSVAALRRMRPDVVVTSGAGVVVPYCLLARLLGSRLIYMETMARVTSASKTGRLLSRIAEATLVQWPETLAQYPRAELCAPPLLPTRADGVAPGGSVRRGTFIALGTHWQPFTRLMAMVDLAIDRGLLPTPVTAQVGEFSYRARGVREVSTVAPEEIARLIAASEVVICHGGAGIISTAIRGGRRPLVLARRGTLSEHVDEHQREIVDKLDELDLVCSIEQGITEPAIQRARAQPAAVGPMKGQPMVEVLAGLLARRPRSA